MTVAELNKIEKARKAYEEDANQGQRIYKNRQDRLKGLVEKHGLDKVVTASGLSKKTLEHYLRTSVAPSISESAVIKAETVLKGF